MTYEESREQARAEQFAAWEDACEARCVAAQDAAAAGNITLRKATACTCDDFVFDEAAFQKQYDKEHS